MKPAKTIIESTMINNCPTGMRVYLFNIIAMMSVPPDVALDLNIKPNPIPKIIPPKIADTNGSSFNNGS